MLGAVNSFLKIIGTACWLGVGFIGEVRGAASPVGVEVDGRNPIRDIPSDFCGLSFETKMVLPNPTTGKSYFCAENLPLISAFRTLGITHLRVGGEYGGAGDGEDSRLSGY